MSEDATCQFDIREYGATSGSDAPATDAIQAALEECAETGGTVVVPPGEFRTGPLRVGDDTTLRVSAGATLRFVEDYDAFPTVESRWEGWDQVGFHPCLFVADASNVAITGRGTIDGSGAYWWAFYETPESERPAGLRERLAEFDERNERADDVSSFTHRPPLLQLYGAENVRISGVTLRNSPFWNTHVVYSENVTIRDVSIENPEHAPNGDGIDIDSSQFVRVSDAYIDAGDDAICLKSGKDEQGREVGEPARDIAVTNCTIRRGHGGVVIGSETAGDVRNVVVSNCTFTDTDRGIRIKSQRGRGGVVEDLRFDTIVMRRVACPFVVNGYYFTPIDSDPEPVDESTPTVRNVHFQHITARDVESAGFFAGLPERRFEGLSFTDVEIDATRPLDATDLEPAMADGYEQTHGLFCKSIADISLRDVRIRTPEGSGPALRFEATDRATLDGLEVEAADPEADEDRDRTAPAAPTVVLENVTATRIRNCAAPREDADGPFVRAAGPATERLSLTGNHGSLSDRVDAADAPNATIEDP